MQALLPGGGNLAVLWVLTACVSGFAAVNQPTRSAVIPALVGPAGVAGGQRAVDDGAAGRRDRRPAAGRACSSGWATSSSPTPSTPLGFLVAALLLRGLPPLPPGGVVGPLRLGAAVRGVGEGFAFLRTQPVLLMTFVVDIIAMTVRLAAGGVPRAVARPGSPTRRTAWAGCSPASRSARC